jgi:hypothetical protein
VVLSRQQADSSRQYLAQMFFLSGLLLPASLQLYFLKASRIVSESGNAISFADQVPTSYSVTRIPLEIVFSS